MAKTVFISYASEDESVAGTISKYLEQSGVSCWIASRDVHPGADYGAEIIDAIETSASLVLVLSEHANSSEFVKREVERAVSKGKPIFPVRVREVAPSKSLELFISSAEWIDAWQPPIEQYLGRLADSIRSAATVHASPGVARPAGLPPGPVVPRQDFQRPVMIGLGLAVIILSVLLARSLMSRPVVAPTATSSSPPPAASSAPSGAASPSSVPAAPGVAVSTAVRATDACPRTLSINRELPMPFSCTCSAQATTESSVWGTDVYTDDSGLCRAAVHAGVISSQGGSITVVRSVGRPLYVGSTRNGVSSSDFSKFPTSIEFQGAAPPPPGPGLCPTYFGINRELPTPFTCRCTAEATQSGTAWGTDVYTDDSGLCRAAMHAGVISSQGGPITVVRSTGRPLYVGSTRNGVSSNDFSKFQSSIEFQGAAPPPPGPGLCPKYFGINRELATPFTCRCTSEATQSGTAWGTDVYTDDSSMCRAAFHAGKIPLTGGTVTVLRADGRALYVGSMRNGVQSNDFGAFPSSITFR
jgi:hypothetical protein